MSHWHCFKIKIWTIKRLKLMNLHYTLRKQIYVFMSNIFNPKHIMCLCQIYFTKKSSLIHTYVYLVKIYYKTCTQTDLAISWSRSRFRFNVFKQCFSRLPKVLPEHALNWNRHICIVLLPNWIKFVDWFEEKICISYWEEHKCLLQRWVIGYITFRGHNWVHFVHRP